MAKYIASLFMLGAMGSVGFGGEVAVNWKKDGGKFVAENRLPPGAKVKVRVLSVTPSLAGIEFEVNGVKCVGKTKGDEFRAAVDKDGKLSIGGKFLNGNHIQTLIEPGLEFNRNDKGECTLKLWVTVEE